MVEGNLLGCRTGGVNNFSGVIAWDSKRGIIGSFLNFWSRDARRTLYLSTEEPTTIFGPELPSSEPAEVALDPESAAVAVLVFSVATVVVATLLGVVIDVVVVVVAAPLGVVMVVVVVVVVVVVLVAVAVVITKAVPVVKVEIVGSWACGTMTIWESGE